jgi:hypothetical protein
MKKISFEEHLDSLASNYGEDYSLVPTTDEIFQGSYKIEMPMSITQEYATATVALAQLETAWAKFKSKPNVIVDQYLNNFLKFLAHRRPEINMAFRQKLALTGITFRDNKLYNAHFNDQKP